MLAAAYEEYDIKCFNIDVCEDNIHLFAHNAAVRVIRQPLDFSLSFAEFSFNFSPVVKTLANLPRLDAFVATTVPCPQAHGSEKDGNHRRKLYNNNFATCWPMASARLIQQVGAYDEHWCPEELNVTNPSVQAVYDLLSDPTHRKATVELLIPSASRRLTAVLSRRFWAYISFSMGNIHNCYILEFDGARREKVSFETYPSSTDTHINLEQSNPCANTLTYSEHFVAPLLFVLWNCLSGAWMNWSFQLLKCFCRMATTSAAFIV